MWNKRFANKQAFTASTNEGYKHGAIFGKLYKAHRVIWIMVYGYEPKTIDHQDGETSNNKLVNLRDATYSENSRNKKTRHNSKSGINGVTWHSTQKKWQVHIQSENGSLYLGMFSDLKDAIDCRKEQDIIHNYHPNHSR